MQFNQLFRKKSVKQVMAGGSDHGHGSSLTKTLGVRDLTAFGIAAIIGAGIFSTIGKASYDGGPGVIFLFMFTAIACSFAAFAYAEFASMVPVSGSAYTYSYVAFGELFAWIIGWALIMEYAIGNVVVAVSWSSYFTALLDRGGLHLPEWMTIDYLTAKEGFAIIQEKISSGLSLAQVAADKSLATDYSHYLAWTNAPAIGSLKLILNIPALLIIALITWLVYLGMKESRTASNIMVAIKLIVVLLIIFVGFFYVTAENYDPFLPNGMGGVLGGVSAVFFAYIGFDAISTTAEECKNPKRDLPRGILYSIVICTILYILIALVLTGLVDYTELKKDDPLAYVFSQIPALNWLSPVIAVSAIIALASVLLVFQMGQPRIWMAMSRDGLLPKRFSKVHPKYKTPAFATVITGLVVGVSALFLSSAMVENLCSIGTLFAFILVCAGVIKLQTHKLQRSPDKFRTPYVNARYVMPVLIALLAYLLSTEWSEWTKTFFSYQDPDTFKNNIPMYLFFLVLLITTVLSIVKNYSLIPVLGLLCCFYMMAQIGLEHWIGFVIWLGVGLIIYFTYSHRNSKLHKHEPAE